MSNSICGKNYSSVDIKEITKRISKVEIMGKTGWTIGEFVDGGCRADVFFLNHEHEQGNQQRYVIKLYHWFGQFSSIDETKNKELKENANNFMENLIEIKDRIINNVLVPVVFFDITYDNKMILCTVEEYHQPLYRYIESTPNIDSVKIALFFALNITEAVIGLNELGINHNDILSENVFLLKNNDPKEGLLLGGFCLSKKIEKSFRMDDFVPETVSPELFCFNWKPTDSESLKKSDMFSIGMSVYFLLNGNRYPLDDNDNEINSAYRLANENVHSELKPPINGSDEFKALVMKAIKYKPEDRFKDYTSMLTAIKDLPEYKK